MINMKQLKEEELENIKGGNVITIWTGIVIASIIIFFSGVIEGITNPERCNG